ncbi:MAG: ATP-binding cassette domain-containing protein [Rhodospirillales bacterium]|nr:ATP-binding cassette domain-containing protein [Rhodospirillales bacterium]
MLAVEDLHTHFRTPRGRVRAVDGVSFSLDRGRTLGIVGESGCGKSVLARTVMGLLPSNARVPPASRVLFDGRDLRGLSERELRSVRGRRMAMIFQDPMTSLNPVMTCGAQVVEALTWHMGLSRRAARDRAVELFTAVGIPEPARRVDHYPHQLSGGMRQRVAIAIALSCEPALLIADEPTTALDVTVQAEILDLLNRQQRERRMALILITHDLGVVAGRTDEIAVMYAGRIVEQARTTVLFSRMRHPYTEALLRSIPRLADPPHTPLVTIAGRPPELIDPPPGCSFAPRCRYAADDCRRLAPALAGDGHAFACWHPLGSPLGPPS